MKNQKLISCEDLNKKLLAYTAGAGAAMLAAPGAQAGIIWSGSLSQDFGTGFGNFELTMEGTVVDLNFMGGSTPDAQAIYVVGGIANSPPMAIMFDAGETIDEQLNFGSPGIFYFTSALVSQAGYWDADNVTGYFGFRFQLENASPNASAGTTVYGWGEVERLSSSSGRLLQWAYDDSGAGIQAGVIPEPGTLTLGLLALGAVGLEALRRRRSAE